MKYEASKKGSHIIEYGKKNEREGTRKGNRAYFNNMVKSKSNKGKR